MMNILKNRLDLLEAKLQALIEGGAARLFPGAAFQSAAFPNDLAYRLVEAMRAGLEAAPDGETRVPSQFVLQANPQDAQILQSNPTTLDSLTRLIVQAGLESGLAFMTQPLLRIYPDPNLAPGVLQVHTGDLLGIASQTAAMEIFDTPEQEHSPVNAYLVIDGTRLFHLSGTVTNIGRQNDNHLVIEDRRVSRRHAQLRVVRGRHMIFDLDSAGGTWVNGLRVHQRMLSPGDIVSLAGLPLVYKMDNPLPASTRELDF